MLDTTIERRRIAREPRSRLYWAISDSWIMTQRSVRHLTRNLDQLLTVVVIPVSILLMFRYVFGGAINTGGIAYVNFVMAGIVVQAIAMNSGTTTAGVSVDMQLGLVERFRSMPMLTSAVLTGHVVAGLLRCTLSTAVVVAVGVVIGFRPTAGALQWLGALGLVLLFSLALLWIAVILGLLAKSVEGANGMNVAFIFVPYLSSAFVPTASMPTALRMFAENQPVTHVVEALRALTIDTPMGDHGWLAVAWCAAISVIAWAFAVRLFRRKTAR